MTDIRGSRGKAGLRAGEVGGGETVRSPARQGTRLTNFSTTRSDALLLPRDREAGLCQSSEDLRLSVCPEVRVGKGRGSDSDTDGPEPAADRERERDGRGPCRQGLHPKETAGNDGEFEGGTAQLEGSERPGGVESPHRACPSGQP